MGGLQGRDEWPILGTPAQNSANNQRKDQLMATRIEKLTIEAAETGIILDIDGAPEGINIEYQILPEVIATLVEEALDYHTAAQGN